MRLLYLALLAAALGGCSKSEGDILQQNFERTTARSGSPDQRCAELRKIADARAREGDAKEFDEAKLAADIDCLHADVVAGR